MVTTKDPYDYIEWNAEQNRNTSFVLKHKGKKGWVWRQRHTGRVGDRWKRRVYDLIILCSMIAVVMMFIKLLLN